MPTIRGLLIEGTTENLLQNSVLTGSPPANWAALLSGTRTPVPSVLGADDGAAAWSLTATSQRPFFESAGLTLAASTDYILSFWVEQFTFTSGNNVMASIQGAGSGATGTTLASTAIPSARPVRVFFRFRTGTGLAAGGVTVRIGLGCLDVATGTMTISRPQLELSETPTSFVATQASATNTRDADIAVKATNTFPYNAAEGSVVVEFRTPKLFGAEGVIVQMDGGNEGTRISLYVSTAGEVRLSVRNAGVDTLNISGGAVTADSRHKAALRYGSSDWALSVDGLAAVTNTAVAVPSSLTIMRRCHGISGRALNGELSQLTFYRSKRSNATLQADSAIAPPPSGTLELFVWGPNSVSASVMEAYGCTTAVEWYWHSTFDTNRDGFRDTPSSTFAVNRSPTASGTLGQLDWEGIGGTGTLSGVSSPTRCVSGYTGTAAQQDIVEQQMISTVNYYRANRSSSTRYCFYDVPHSNQSFNILNSQTGSWWNVPNVLSTAWINAVDAITPSCYTRWQEGSDDYPRTVSRTSLYTCQRNRAINAMRVSEKVGFTKKVFPMVSRIYYANDSALSFHDTLAPQEWFYHHCRGLGDALYNGRRIDGLFLWDKNGVSALTETQLKVAWQGLRRLPYDPNMPRPS